MKLEDILPIVIIMLLGILYLGNLGAIRESVDVFKEEIVIIKPI